jgi:DNA/RNA endonuclease G (NUC1)
MMTQPDNATSGHPPASQPAEASALVDVFISYARTDQAIAENVAETLRSEGFEVWFDKSIYAGADWENMILSTLASAKAILVLWSTRSVDRPWVIKEAAIGMQTRKLVPAKIDDCKLPEGFASLQTAKMIGWNGSDPHPELERLLAGLAHLAPPSRLDNVRPGFDTSFLGIEIGLPAVTGVAEEFRYLHFSVVMNPARRLAWYTAYNMQPPEKVKRGDRWMPDPMLPVAFQPHNNHFLGSGFDRGHLVSPRTVSWGTSRQAELANHQSFFWTNTSPQHPDMNRGWWLAVEQWEREIVDRHQKAVGFSGPVLAEDDPIHRDLEQSFGRLRVRQNFRLPRKFWKIIAIADEYQQIQTAAFLLDQEALVKNKASLKLKSDEFRCSIAEIETQTGLDFGDLLRGASSISYS